MAGRAEELYDGRSLDVVAMTLTRPHPALSSAPPCASPIGGRRAGALWSSAFGAGLVLLLAACDGAGPRVDASAPISAHTSAVSLRIDVAAGKPASLSVLAFHAAFSGVAAADVLGMVDPLAADAPRRDCQLRDVDQAAAALVARGDAIELEELAGVGVVLADNPVEIRPSPRLYPDLAATIGGVVGEAGPLGLSVLPTALRVRGGTTLTPDSSGTLGSSESAVVNVPETGWIRLVNGMVPRDGLVIPTTADVSLSLTPVDAAETSIEVRPFGATVALSCAVPTDSVPVGGQILYGLSREAMNALLTASGVTPGTSAAAALDLVRRSSKQLPLSATRVSLEVRTSTFVELRP